MFKPFPCLWWFGARMLYARWALQYIPPLLPNGEFNEEYQKLSDWITAYDKAMEKLKS